MQEFLEAVVKGMVANPEDVVIEPVERRGETVYEIRVHPSDVGRLVGRRGNTINAIRTLLTAGASRKGLRCSLELLEERSSSGGNGGGEDGPDGGGAPRPATGVGAVGAPVGDGRRGADRGRDRDRDRDYGSEPR